MYVFADNERAYLIRQAGWHRRLYFHPVPADYGTGFFVFSSPAPCALKQYKEYGGKNNASKERTKDSL